MFSKKVNQQQVLGVYRGNQAKKHRKRNRDNKTPLSCVLHFGSYSTFPWAPVTDLKKGTGRGENAKRLKWERYWRLPFPLFVRPPPPASLQKQTLKIYYVQSLQVDPVLDLCQSCQSCRVNPLTQRFITLIPSSSNWSFFHWCVSCNVLGRFPSLRCRRFPC